MIHTHRWTPPPGSRRRSRGVYVLHGMGEHAARYERLATRLAAEGWTVAAHDHPGHGRSAGRRGVADPPDTLVARAGERLERFADELGAAPILFGHSLGGVVATELVLARRVPVAALALSAPAIVPRLTRANAIRLAVLSRLAPRLAVELPYDASVLTRDPEEIARAHADELVHGFKSAGLVRWLIDAAHRAIERAPELELPTLVLIAGADRLVDTDRTRAFAARVPAAYRTVHVYDDCHHELLNERPEERERVTTDIVRWLDALDALDGATRREGDARRARV